MTITSRVSKPDPNITASPTYTTSDYVAPVSADEVQRVIAALDREDLYEADWRDDEYFDIPRPERKPVVPSRRTAQKAGREATTALVGFAIAYMVANKADIGITPEIAVAIPVVMQFAWRWIRGLSGNEPAV